MVNQNGQTAPLPETDPSGPGAANWELEESLDVEWAHAIAPGAQIVVVEANSQSLSDLMASVATAAGQPGVSVVSMSWGLPEGQAVFASDEATYDSVFNVPGVTFVASTGDYGAADPEYPAFSPNVVAVGGTSLTLNDDNSYNSETGWGYQSDSAGAFIGSGGGISLYEPEPAYQQGVQSTGSRTTPDVSFVADPATGAWIADPYNLSADNPFEVVGGTSLSAPTWAGLVALVNEGRAIAGEPTLNSSSPTETQQALYSLPQSDYNVITSGFNGYTANAGYNLVTGLGTPVANLLVGDLVDYQGPGTVYSGPTVGALQDATLVEHRLGRRRYEQCLQRIQCHHDVQQRSRLCSGARRGQHDRTTTNAMPAQNAVASHSPLTPLTTLGSTMAMTPSSSPQSADVRRRTAWATGSPPSPRLHTHRAELPVHARFGNHEATAPQARPWQPFQPIHVILVGQPRRIEKLSTRSSVMRQRPMFRLGPRRAGRRPGHVAVGACERNRCDTRSRDRLGPRRPGYRRSSHQQKWPVSSPPLIMRPDWPSWAWPPDSGPAAPIWSTQKSGDSGCRSPCGNRFKKTLTHSPHSPATKSGSYPRLARASAQPMRSRAASVQSSSGSGMIPTRPRSSRSASQHT